MHLPAAVVLYLCVCLCTHTCDFPLQPGESTSDWRGVGLQLHNREMERMPEVKEGMQETRKCGKRGGCLNFKGLLL